MKKTASLTVCHDSFSWKKSENITSIAVAKKTYIDVIDATKNGYFCVGLVYYNGQLLDEEMPYGAFHIPSKNVFSVWENRYLAEVYADTVSNGRDWSQSRMVFKTALDASLFASTPQIIEKALGSGGKPVDPSFMNMSGAVH